jgi:cysteine desulfurase
MKTVYVDNNATTMVAPEVLETMLPYFKDQYGNPSSMHTFGGQVGFAIKEARAKVADLIGASAEEIVFTGCGTESDNTAIWAALQSQPEKRQVITTRVEHPAVKSLAESLAKKGYRVTFVPVDGQGNLDLEVLYDSLSEDTAIVSVMWANNETGVLFPIDKIARRVRERGIVFHTDAVQAVGKIPIDVRDCPVDMLSMSGHKIHAPKGIGVLYVRKGTRFSPHLIGGHQENGRRGGTENTAAIVGLGKAAELAATRWLQDMDRVRQLRDKLENSLLERVSKAMINGDRKNRLPNTTSIAFEYVEGESILLMMDQYGICASSGSACTSGSLEPSHVLRAMGVPFTAAHGSIRFSLGTYNSEEDIETIIEKLPRIIERLRAMSPFWQEAQAAAG